MRACVCNTHYNTDTTALGVSVLARLPFLNYTLGKALITL